MDSSAVKARSIPAVHCGSVEEFREKLATSNEPRLVSGLVSEWPAYEDWTLDTLADQFGDQMFRVVVDVPKDTSPYNYTAEDYLVEMPLHEAFRRIKCSDSVTYIRRQELSKYPGAAAQLRVDGMSPPNNDPKHFFLWIGKNTLTGLHYDFTQGMLCQIMGSKTVYMAAPSDSHKLSPIIGSPAKSHFLPSNPDFDAHPKAASVEFWTGELNAGQLLVIPRLWWHSIISKGASVSVSHDFGRNLANSEVLKMLLCGGPRQLLRIIQDLIVYGIFNKPVVRILTDDPPFGQVLYHSLKSSIARRVNH